MLLTHYRKYHFTTIDSTQKEIIRRSETGHLCHGDVVLARKQTSGMGRLGKKWVSDYGNLYLTIAVKKNPVAKITEVPFFCALAVRKTLANLIPHKKVRCKWVNDILIDLKKIAGILCQARGDYFIIGIGINIKNSPNLPDKKTTFLREYSSLISYKKLYLELLHQFSFYHNKWVQDGFKFIREEWLENSHIIGEEISVNSPCESYVGEYKGIDEQGNLLIVNDRGVTITISSGEVL